MYLVLYSWYEQSMESGHSTSVALHSKWETCGQTHRQPMNPCPGYGFSKGWETQPAPVPRHTLPVTHMGSETLDNPYVQNLMVLHYILQQFCIPQNRSNPAVVLKSYLPIEKRGHNGWL